MTKMTSLKILIAVLLVAIASLAYILLTRFFPSEEIFFMGFRPLTRALVLDLSIKNKDYPSFLPENSGFLVVHPTNLQKIIGMIFLKPVIFLLWLKKLTKIRYKTGTLFIQN